LGGAELVEEAAVWREGAEFVRFCEACTPGGGLRAGVFDEKNVVPAIEADMVYFLRGKRSFGRWSKKVESESELGKRKEGSTR